MDRLLGLAAWLAAAVLLPPALSAQESGGQTSAITGTVVAPGGRPAAGATVWLIKGTYDQTDRPLARVTTDERGRLLSPVWI